MKLIAEELRIGNLVYWEKKVFPICQINSSGFYHLRVYSNIINGLLSEGKVEAIPITEEWLIKFSFIPLDDDGLWEAENKELFRIQEPTLSEGHICAWNTYDAGQPIEFVHQLQNLYFALTGEELTLNTESK